MSTSKGHNVGEDSFLKTTTWGTLIAFSLVAVAWSVTNYARTLSEAEDSATIAYARPVSGSATARQAAPKHESFLADALRHISKLNPFGGSKGAGTKNAVLSAQAQVPTNELLTSGHGLKP